MPERLWNSRFVAVRQAAAIKDTRMSQAFSPGAPEAAPLVLITDLITRPSSADVPCRPVPSGLGAPEPLACGDGYHRTRPDRARCFDLCSQGGDTGSNPVGTTRLFGASQRRNPVGRSDLLPTHHAELLHQEPDERLFCCGVALPKTNRRSRAHSATSSAVRPADPGFLFVASFMAVCIRPQAPNRPVPALIRRAPRSPG